MRLPIDNDAVPGSDQGRILNGGENVFPFGDGAVTFRCRP